MTVRQPWQDHPQSKSCRDNKIWGAENGGCTSFCRRGRHFERALLCYRNDRHLRVELNGEANQSRRPTFYQSVAAIIIRVEMDTCAPNGRTRMLQG